VGYRLINDPKARMAQLALRDYDARLRLFDKLIQTTTGERGLPPVGLAV
jgi:hypothetical protein